MSQYQNMVSVIKSRLKESAPLIQFIMGPRQVGKTTGVELIRQGFDEDQVLYCNADGIALADWIRENWQKAKLEKRILIIDEIQKIPNWSEVVKALWDDSVSKKSVKVLT